MALTFKRWLVGCNQQAPARRVFRSSHRSFPALHKQGKTACKPCLMQCKGCAGILAQQQQPVAMGPQSGFYPSFLGSQAGNHTLAPCKTITIYIGNRFYVYAVTARA